ncbi:hypothetical protein AGMMS50230_20240 [Spirochaetia bacterium]|nr:hypothetical protein AGMMS50230_20240 [Spirochaetia bacterium]
MSDTDAVLFSNEEQKEISGRIEAAAAREPIVPPGLPARKEVSRRGLFPLLVNAAAILLLGGGIFFLFSFHKADTAEIRDSGAELGITERALIQEIRKEVTRQLAEKEAAIETMKNRLAGVDAELERLDSLEALSDEQRAAMEELRRQQEEYRGSLGQLQTERAQILAEARKREAEAHQRELSLHARLEEQQGVLENLSAASRAEITAAREELAKLSGEQEKAVLVERQLSGYYAAVSRQIQAGQYREVLESLASLKEFLATPALVNLKTIQARRDSDAAAVAALSALAAEALKDGSAGIAGAAIPAAVTDTSAPPAAATEAALRQQLASQTAALAEQNAALAELQKNLTALEEQNAAGRQSLAERDRQLENLRTQNTANQQTIDNLQRTISNITAALGN